MIHGSAGCGKTYLLREIALKKPEDIVGRDVSNIKFIPISFNTKTSIIDDEMRLGTNLPEFTCGQFFGIPRIIHSAFLRNSISFKVFMVDFLMKFSVDYICSSKMMKEFDILLKSKFPGKKIVLLIDELSKLDAIENSHKWPTSEYVRNFYCTLMDGDAPMVSQCVFSSLSFLKLGEIEVLNTTSDRLVKNIGKLDMFSLKESKEIIQDFFRENGIEVVMSNDGKVPRTEKDQKFDEAVNRIYILSGGHPRTLDTLLQSILTFDKNKTSITTRNPAISDLLSYIISKEFRDSNKTSNSNFECVRCIFNAKAVRYEQNVPGLTITFDQAIKLGQLIGSNDYNDYVPYLPIINLWCWAKDNLNNDYKDVSFEIIRMMEVGVHFNPLLFEEFCYRRELVLSFFRQTQEEYKSITLDKLFRNGLKPITTMRSDIFLTEVNAFSPLKLINYKELSGLSNIKCGLLVPVNRQNRGFDYIIRYPVVSVDEYIDVYFQIKYSDENSTTKINDDTIRNYYRDCEIVSKNKPFVFVMFGWREKTNCLYAPDNCVILDRTSLATEFGSTLAQFTSVQELSPIRYSFISPLISNESLSCSYI
jgi:hypothetical protein